MTIKMTPVVQKYILHWGEMGTRWGVNRVVSQIHALLYLSPEPQHADEIAQMLSVARSSVSTGLKELQSWGLINVVHVFGDRRDYFSTQSDTWEMLMTIMEERKKREIEPTLTLLRQCVIDMQEDQETPNAVKDKIEHMLNFVSTLSEWFEDVKALPKSSLVKLMKLGAKVAKFIPGERRSH